jgi:hypothetical protein
MLVLNGYKSYKSAGFQEYYKTNNIITFCFPAHSSHLIQPLDVRCFSILKRMYGRQIKLFIKAYINYITKVEFFLVFHAVYNQSITTQNTKTRFRGASLVVYDLQVVISRLNIKLRIPTPLVPSSIDINP